MEMRKWLLLIMILISFSGCATVEVSTPDGLSIKTTTLWKDIEAAEAQTENMVLSLGRSGSVDEAKTLMAMCLLFPNMEGC
jgi:uncharacterized protein YceK